MLYNRI